MPDWSQLDRRVTSPEFLCAGYRFRILLFPWGNGAQNQNLVSIYLECVDFSQPNGKLAGGQTGESPGGDTGQAAAERRKTKSYDDHVCIQFSLVLSNPLDPKVHVRNSGQHRYTPDEVDWGFTRFADLLVLSTPQGGRSSVVEGKAVRVSAFVRAIKDEKGVLWHNFAQYDSKATTGHVGLKNQGATCYMNSLLQSLFCTNLFRRAVYEVPTEGETPSDSVALALQRVFYHLQTSTEPVGTTELTRSFGWKSLDSFLQHDVQEFNRVLQDKLESKMKGTTADGMIPRLFVGKMKSYIKCINVKYESSRTEDFYDIQLNVKGLPTLLDSFRDYVQVERLDGDNQYRAEGYGLQDAMKGVIFESFPPVLHLQLKRFEYDIERDAMVKINDRYEYPLEVDLGEFIDKDSPGYGEAWTYSLTGVLVHSGDLHGGHYFGLLKPDVDGEWYKFDDDRVTPATEREVLEDNFGGAPHARGQPLKRVGQPIKRFTNAYMLVYVRNAEMGEVLKPLTDEETPAHLKRRIEDERREHESLRRLKEEQHLYLNLRPITLEHFKQYQGFDLAKVSERGPSMLLDVPSVRMLRSEPFAQAKEKLAALMSLVPDQMRVWVLVWRQNRTIRPEEVVPEDKDWTLEEVRERLTARSPELWLFLEPLSTVPPVVLAEPDKWSLLFLKHFDPVRQTLLGAGTAYVQPGEPVSSLLPTIREMMGWASETELKLFEEIKPGMIDPMNLDTTFGASEILVGDIICFQGEGAAEDGSPSDPIVFYDFLHNKVEVGFHPLPGTEGPAFTLPLNRRLGHEALAQRVGRQLDVDGGRLRFTLANGSNQMPSQVLKSNAPMAVYDIAMAAPQAGGAKAYYEVLDVPLFEMEAKRPLTIYWMGINNKEEGERRYLLHKSTTFTALQYELAKVEKLEEHPRIPLLKSKEGEKEEVPTLVSSPADSMAYNLPPPMRIRLSQITDDGRGQVQFHIRDTVEKLGDDTEVYAEEVPGDEMELIFTHLVDPSLLNPERKVVSVMHFHKDASRAHGVPFRFVLCAGESLDDMKARLRARLAITEKEFGKIKIARVPQKGSAVEYLEDSAVPFDKITEDHLIGLDHLDRSARGHRLALAAAQDRGIRIS